MRKFTGAGRLFVVAAAVVFGLVAFVKDCVPSNKPPCRTIGRADSKTRR